MSCSIHQPWPSCSYLTPPQKLSVSSSNPKFHNRVRCTLTESLAEANPSSTVEPLLLRAVRGETVQRPPVWLMRQAGRYMKSYRELCEKYPMFRERSENVELAVRISLQPWKSFKPDGVKNEAAVLGFVGAPFTLASYVIEGGSSKHFAKIKQMAFQSPKVLHALLKIFAESMVKYIQYQADSGAQVVQIFDSWATELSPVDFEEFSLPYLKHIVDSVKRTHPSLPLILYASGSGGLLERLYLSGVDVISLDWKVDMAEARKRLGENVAVQGNVDPGALFGSKDFIKKRIYDTVAKAGRNKHVLNLGHGVLVGTPEENVAHFFEVAKGITY
ncbi:uroporphyrinogen decarboxylase, chloroplastic isoform X2 [Cryptomeria japonica]|uniref:uroporphyrinogen decarboxylase, chloroplastic isoform X2 n=1 Tax=Cryptomeria japonica TaxID=3369 RepID=UPI0025ABF987|nr:uroporphyrinogen decarboxylase, chloroplastic isoform X2 [Cryptomeria japonica]